MIKILRIFSSLWVGTKCLHPEINKLETYKVFLFQEANSSSYYKQTKALII